MISQLRPALVFVGFFTVLLGLAYPLVMTGLGQTFFPSQANGSMITRDGQIVGSTLIGQDFTRPEYLHGRPSATEPAYDGSSSTGSNLAPSSQELLDQVKARAETFGSQPVPSEMLTASGSGLDPHITLKAALMQAPRIATARGIPEADIVAAINATRLAPGFGILGDPLVNVLETNLALDALKG